MGVDPGQEAVETLPSFVIDEVNAALLLDRMWQLRGNITAYVAAAEMLACPLVTGDARLGTANGVRREVRLVGVA
ncbi:hypothetical protein [Micromonospora sp. HK10]|uniref:hypothetical protein n=1 Tax=Micromonospora sp. HK10 TaxID=1538294 RepID=UPI0006968D50|nr:hypothetical protein [Micromonospora sp. HK10]